VAKLVVDERVSEGWVAASTESSNLCDSIEILAKVAGSIKGATRGGLPGGDPCR
jgi:hypothetical protein